MKIPTLETPRLILREFTEYDLPALYEIHRDGEVNRFLPWFPFRTVEDARAFYDTRLKSQYRQGRGYHYAVCPKETGYPVGYVDVDGTDGYELGYGLGRAFWGQGLMTEAGRAVVEQLKRDGIPYITATHDVNNPRSGRVMGRLGMKYQYSYQEQWVPKDFLVTFRLYLLNIDGDDSRIYKKYWDQSAVHFVEADV